MVLQTQPRNNITGTYKIVDGECVRVSENIPNIRDGVYLPSGGKWYEEFNDKANPHGRFIENKAQKRQVLKELHLAEV